MKRLLTFTTFYKNNRDKNKRIVILSKNAKNGQDHTRKGDTQSAFTYSKLATETLEQGGEICSKLTIKTLERHHWIRSSIFIVNFENISHIVLEFQLLTFSR